MRFIHCADIHLDSPFSNKKDLAMGKSLFNEQQATFKNMFEYAKNNQVRFVLIAGDLFDGENVNYSTLCFINSVFANYPEIEVLIIPGNHDLKNNNSIIHNFTFSSNVFVFNKPTIKTIEDCSIYGGYNVEQLTNIRVSLNTFNILMWHGETSMNKKSDNYNTLPISIVDQLSFDYVAMGHIHQNSIVKEQPYKIVYPGCLSGRGFDELGPKGFYLVDINSKNIKETFIPMLQREYLVETIDAAMIINDYSPIVNKVKELIYNKGNNNLYKFVLTGNRTNSDSINVMALSTLCDSYAFYIKFVDKTTYNTTNNQTINTLLVRFNNRIDNLINSEKDALQKDVLIKAKKLGNLAILGKDIPYEN